MLNIYDFVNENRTSRKFRVDELLFLDYDCPVDDERLETWTHINFFFYMLRGNLMWKTPDSEYTVKTGEAVFIKKGAQLAFKELNHHFCALLFFVPDEFIRKVIQIHLPSYQINPDSALADSVIPLEIDDTLSFYFKSVLHYFSKKKPPNKSLLKIKFEELILHLLTSNKNYALRLYFNEICQTRRRSVEAIMENNFRYNLKLNDYAKLCDRSLATFKRDFKKIYHSTPGKMLNVRLMQ
jgi:CRISPR/Cas system-associated endonuclease/helicase Cas3